MKFINQLIRLNRACHTQWQRSSLSVYLNHHLYEFFEVRPSSPFVREIKYVSLWSSREDASVWNSVFVTTPSE